MADLKDFPNRAEAAATARAEATEVAMASILQMVANLQETITELKKEKEALVEKADVDDKLPTVHHKDLDKPNKYDGKEWPSWNDSFKNVLGRRDPRWKALLEEIQKKEFVNSPLTDEKMLNIRENLKISEQVQAAFTGQLYEYLRGFTMGEPLSVVQAAGAKQSLEVWRRMSDQGRSLRERPLREEQRALYHPKQLTEDQLVKGLAAWEQKLLSYQAAKPQDETDMTENIKNNVSGGYVPSAYRKDAVQTGCNGKVQDLR